jgi:hypothetical protein
MNFSPILRDASLVENAVEDVGVDHVGPGHSDVVAGSGHPRVNKTPGIGIVVSEQKAFWVLRDDFHDQVRVLLMRAGLERVGAFRSPEN